MSETKDPASASSPVNSAQLEQTIGDLGRKLSTSSLLLQEVLAERLGLSATESKCLDIIQRAESEGPVTPSLLVERTGLTSGAITGLLDRLEAARFVRREKSPTDRRQVIVRTISDREHEVRGVYGPYMHAFRELIAQYEPGELLVIGRFVRESIELIERYAKELRGQMKERATDEPSRVHDMSVPLGEVRTGALEVVRGASGLSVGAADESQLYRVATDGTLPEVSMHRGTLRFQQKRAGVFDFKRHRLELLLNPTIPWEMRVKGGISYAHFDLEALQLSSFEISGGLSNVELSLPPPRGTVRASVRGGANHLSVRRPPGTAISVLVHSGASGLSLDNLHLGSVGGKTEWQSPDYANATNKYELEIMGGANKLLVGVSER